MIDADIEEDDAAQDDGEIQQPGDEAPLDFEEEDDLDRRRDPLRKP